MNFNTSGAAASLALNATNAIVHALVVRGVFTGPQAAELLADIAEQTRKDNIGAAGEDLAAWLDDAAGQYRAG